MDNQEVAGRIRQLMRELNVKQLEFAEKIGIDASNLSKYLNGKIPVSEAFVNKIVVNLGVSKRWLEQGGGSPFESVVAAASPAVTVPAITMASGAIESAERPTAHGTPVYDIDVTAGALPRARMFSDDLIIGYINLPQLDARDRIVTVSGDSMAPVIRSGDMVAIRETPNKDLIFWGQIYVVLTENFRLVKYMRRHPDPSMVILRSENPNYDDIDMPRRDILDLMLVHDIIRFDRRL